MPAPRRAHPAVQRGAEPRRDRAARGVRRCEPPTVAGQRSCAAPAYRISEREPGRRRRSGPPAGSPWCPMPTCARWPPPASTRWSSRAARAARTAGRELIGWLRRPRPGRAADHLGLHRRLPAGAGPGCWPESGRPRTGPTPTRWQRQLPRRARRPGADLHQGRRHRHLGRRHRGHRPGAGAGRGGHRAGRGAGRRPAAGGVPAPAGRPGAVQCPAAGPGRAARTAARGAAVDHRAARRRPVRGALAARAGLSPRQFARSFAAQTGVPPGRYVDRVRLEAARRQLEDTGAGRRADRPRAAATGPPRRCGARSSGPSGSPRPGTGTASGTGISRRTAVLNRQPGWPAKERTPPCRSRSCCMTGSPPWTPSGRTRC